MTDKTPAKDPKQTAKGTVYRATPELETARFEPEAAPRAPDSAEAEILGAKAEVLEAEAKLIKAKTEQAKAKQPLIDRIIMRGLIPVALTIVGPWALYAFNADNEKTHEQVAEVEDVVEDLTELLGQAVAEREERTRYSQREDEARAAELTALAVMVTRLRDTLRMMTVRQALRDVLDSDESMLRTGDLMPPMMPVPSPLRVVQRQRLIEQTMMQLLDERTTASEVEELRDMVEVAVDARAWDQAQDQAQRE